jgi:hypothetical protein
MAEKLKQLGFEPKWHRRIAYRKYVRIAPNLMKGSYSLDLVLKEQHAIEERGFFVSELKSDCQSEFSTMLNKIHPSVRRPFEERV